LSGGESGITSWAIRVTVKGQDYGGRYGQEIDVGRERYAARLTGKEGGECNSMANTKNELASGRCG